MRTAFFLRLKHWQLFSLIIFMMIIAFAFFMIGSEMKRPAFLYIGLPISIFLSASFFYGWLYSFTNFFHKQMYNETRKISLKFKASILFQVFFLAFFVFNNIANNFYIEPEKIKLSPLFIYTLFPMFFLSIISFFYSIWYAAKILKSMELKRNTSFGDFAIEFILIWFFYVGIWLLQPKINKLFYSRSLR